MYPRLSLPLLVFTVGWTVCPVSPLVGPVLAADWPQHLGPNRDGHSPETGLNWRWPAMGPAVLWSVPVGAGWSGPVVAGGVVYLHHRQNAEQRLSAYDAATGQPRWTYTAATRYADDFRMNDGPRATPTVTADTVYLLGADGDLHAVDRKTGQGRWRKELRSDYGAGKGFFGIAGSPLVTDGLVIVVIGGSKAGAGVVALDATTGTERWKATNHEAGYASPILADWAGRRRVVAFTRKGLVALELATGAVVFELPFRSRLDASVNAATPLALDGHLFATASYGTGAIVVRPDTTGAAEEVWSNDQTISSQYNTPLRVGEFLFGTDGRSDYGNGRLRCLHWKTGVLHWTQDRFGCASLIGVDGKLLALTESGELVAIEPSTERYQEIARASLLSGKVRALPALADGRFFARDDEKLIAVKLN